MVVKGGRSNFSTVPMIGKRRHHDQDQAGCSRYCRASTSVTVQQVCTAKHVAQVCKGSMYVAHVFTASLSMSLYPGSAFWAERVDKFQGWTPTVATGGGGFICYNGRRIFQRRRWCRRFQSRNKITKIRDPKRVPDRNITDVVYVVADTSLDLVVDVLYLVVAGNYTHKTKSGIAHACAHCVHGTSCRRVTVPVFWYGTAPLLVCTSSCMQTQRPVHTLECRAYSCH